ncbi:HNH endonuclease [Arthrobacter sp. UM1]|uniref:HNH endonuclease n=1 Tax=Arthrobacter sp. UM1 TaxID=2766776 RepID=UPI001CF6FB0D|nr:HNH endonuclease [Arthrobacter sp. UM1]MCB4209171.1 HNH endonuclease [Arthrobacter sp. UM1]
MLLARDGLTCCICRTPIKSAKAATIEHKTKRRDGGSHDLANLGLAHSTCNYADAGRSPTTSVGTISNGSFFW